ncbi:hypothetical protein Btru_078090 [Bulinus truncatus]|nr:hypothetical protein Btru_078090 [Bulinus truncatus]
MWTIVKTTGQGTADKQQLITLNDDCEKIERMEAMNTYFQLLDNLTGELDKRFGAIQSDIAIAVLATSVNSPTFMDMASLQPLADLASIKLDKGE